MRARTLVLLSLILFSAHTVAAGPVTGKLVDQGGGAIAGAHVLLVENGIASSTAITDARGIFTFTTADSGRVELRFAAPGFGATPLLLDAHPQPRDIGTITLAVSAISEALIVSAAQVEVPLSQVSSSVTVMTGEELAARQVHTVADALRTVPGLSVAATGGTGSVTAVFPRGGESDYTMVVVDGVQANAFGGLYDFGHLSTENIDRIEVVRGPQSALFGSNAIGSVVRVVTRRGGSPNARGAVEYGSGATWRTSATASGGAGAAEFGASFERLTSDGRNGTATAAGEPIVNDDYARHAFTVTGGWRTSGVSVGGSVRYARDERGFPGPFGSNPIGAYAGIDSISRGTDDRWLAGAHATIPLGGRARLQARATGMRLDAGYRSPSFIGPAEPPAESETLSRRWTARSQVDVNLSPAVDLSSGIEVLGERAGSTYITGAAFQMIPVKRRSVAYFAEVRARWLDRLFVNGGLRVDDLSRDALEGHPDAFSPRPPFAADLVVSANPKLSAAAFVRSAPGSFTKLRAAAGTGIRPPDGLEIAFTDNPSLKPERSLSYEAGIDQAFAGGRGLIEATAFSNRFDDLIVAVGSFVEASRYRTDNIANARARGLEVAASGRAMAAASTTLELRMAYTFLDTDVLALDSARVAAPPFAVGDPLPRRPRHQLTGHLTVSSSRLTAYVQADGRGRALDVEPNYGTFGGLFHTRAYHVWNAGAAWRLRRGLEVFARLDNLFDRTYEEALGFPAPGRRAFAGLRVAAGR